MKSGKWAMRVIFLDVDGVLNNEPAFVEMGQKVEHCTDVLDPDCIRRLGEIVRRTDAKIVEPVHRD